MRLLYLWLAVVIFTVIPNNKALSKQKNVFKITIVDRPRYSSTLDITFYDDSASFKLMDLHKVKINNAKKKSVSDDCFDYVWVSRTINDIEDSTSNYLRKSILDFFCYENKPIYKYYKKLEHTYQDDPGPAYLHINIYKENEKKRNFRFALTNDVNSNKPLGNGQAEIVYSDEYKIFLDTLLKLTYKYTTKFKGPWHKFGDNNYGWYWWEEMKIVK